MLSINKNRGLKYTYQDIEKRLRKESKQWLPKKLIKRGRNTYIDKDVIFPVYLVAKPLDKKWKKTIVAIDIYEKKMLGEHYILNVVITPEFLYEYSLHFKPANENLKKLKKCGLAKIINKKEYSKGLYKENENYKKINWFYTRLNFFCKNKLY